MSNDLERLIIDCPFSKILTFTKVQNEKTRKPLVRPSVAFQYSFYPQLIHCSTPCFDNLFTTLSVLEELFIRRFSKLLLFEKTGSLISFKFWQGHGEEKGFLGFKARLNGIVANVKWNNNKAFHIAFNFYSVERLTLEILNKKEYRLGTRTSKN